MIVIIELILLVDVWGMLDFVDTNNEKKPNHNNNMFYNHLKRFLAFLVQDIILGYFWLLYREQTDALAVYSEFDMATFSIFRERISTAKLPQKQ